MIFMPLDLDQNRGPIDETDATFRDVFQDLQGNILSGHGRKHAVHFFLHFNCDRIADVRKWIARFAANHVTSAYDQFEAARAYRENGVDAGVFGHFALSAKGYCALGVTEGKIPEGTDPRRRRYAHPAPDPDQGDYSDVFTSGLASRQRFLLDPPQDQWEPGYNDPEKPIHAMFFLAADDAAEMIAVERSVLAELSGIATVLTGERGLNLKKRFSYLDPEDGVAVEHFGYVDGRSQPLFLKKQADRETHSGAGSFWDPRAPLNLVLVPDPNGTPSVSFGSFLVFRKLEQNVREFRRHEQALAHELGLPTELVGAMAVGRFKDGTPVVLQPGDGARPIPNDFNYGADPGGVTCPFHAHIRKTNPRLDSVRFQGPFAQSSEEELGHRIARRGIPYGGPLSDSSNPDNLPRGGVGLLFFCYQADLWEQFEFMQRFWSNNPGFLQPDFDTKGKVPLPEDQRRGSRNYPDATGLDAVIGQKIEGQSDPVIGHEANAPTHWPQAWGKPPACPVSSDFAQFVTLKGGEYFFAPCMSFLRTMV
jgi:Dyp-type peroxidase family